MLTIAWKKKQPQRSPVGYALKLISVSDNVFELVLDLFKGSSPASTTRIAKVARKDLDLVLSRCIARLEQLGASPVSDTRFRRRASA